MKKEYKLIDRNLIRTYGKLSVSLDPTIGDRLVREGKARPAISGAGNRKSMHFPPQHKAVFHPPEEKAFEDIGQEDKRYPGPEDKLFSNIGK